MLQVKEITSKTIWEEFLLKNGRVSFPFFQSWSWGEIENYLGFQTLRLGIFDENTLIGVCQVIDVDAKRGHFLYLRHGPVFTTYSPEVFSFFLNFVKKIAQEKNASCIRVSRFPKTDTLTRQFFEEKGFKKAAIQTIDAQVCWVLNITKCEEDLLKNMRKSHRYLIKKAPSFEVKIVQTSQIKDIKKFLPLYKKLSVRKHFVAHTGVTEEFETFAKNNEEVLFLAQYQKKIIAGAVIAFVGNTAIYRHSASDNAYKNIPASYLIQWEAIKEAKKRGKKIYNFWGVAPENEPNHPWRGISLFKTGFGGTYEYFFETMDLPLNISYLKTYLIDWMSAKRKELGF